MSIINYIDDINEIIYQLEYELNDIQSEYNYEKELLHSLKSLKDAVSSLEKAENILLDMIPREPIKIQE